MHVRRCVAPPPVNIRRRSCSFLFAQNPLHIQDVCPGGCRMEFEFPGSVAQLWCSPGVAAQDPLISPSPEPAALSPSKREARREANKCSWGARVNQTFCRSLVKSLVIRLGGTCGRDMPSRILECLPGKGHDPSFENMCVLQPQDQNLGSPFLASIRKPTESDKKPSANKRTLRAKASPA